MDSLTERIKKAIDGDGPLTLADAVWRILDQEIVAWKKERSKYLKDLYPQWAGMDKTINQAFELSEPERCQVQVINAHNNYTLPCGKTKPCPVHDKKVEISDSAWKINQDIHKSSKPQKKPLPSERIIELTKNTQDSHSYVCAIIKFLDERLG